MKVAGVYTLESSREQVWPKLCDAATLGEIVPGCQQLEQVSPTEYRGRIQLRLPALVGEYTTYVKLVDINEPDYCRFEGKVEGAPGTVSGTASFRLSDQGCQTTIEYEGQGLITGPLAQLNDRFAIGIANTLIRQGLARLNRQLQVSPDIEGNAISEEQKVP